MDMREPFELQMQRTMQNESGDVSVEWKTVLKGFARVSNLGSREFWEASAVSAENTLKFFTRYHPVFDSVDSRSARIVWRGKPLNVTAIDNVDFQNEKIIIRAVSKNE